MEVCGAKSSSVVEVFGVEQTPFNIFFYASAFLALGAIVFGFVRTVRKRRAEKMRPKLQGEEVSQVVEYPYTSYGAIVRTAPKPTREDFFVLNRDPHGDLFVGPEYYPERPLWVL
jgi:hypothetical protein